MPIKTMLLAAAALATTAVQAEPLHVTAEIVAKPENAAAIRQAMASVETSARKEAGCLSYQVYEDRGHAGRFITWETWTDDAALNAHLGSPAMKAGAQKLGPLLASPPVITRLKPE